MASKFYSVAEAARYLRLSPVRVRKLCLSGRLGTKVGAAYVITEAELYRFASIPRPPGRPRTS